MKTPRLSDVAVNAEIDALTALLNGGFIDFYDGSQPATADTAISTQVRLASLSFGTPAFGAGVAGVAVANAITPDSDADATGTASWYRCWKSDHTTSVTDGSIGTSGANINMATTSIVQHATVTLPSFSLTAAKS
jgi:hypothetical protein